MNTDVNMSLPRANDLDQMIGRSMKLYSLLDKELEVCANHSPSVIFDEDERIDSQETALFEIRNSLLTYLSEAPISNVDDARNMKTFWEENADKAECVDVIYYNKIALNLMNFYQAKM